jgi:hypothetical protein
MAAGILPQQEVSMRSLMTVSLFLGLSACGAPPPVLAPEIPAGAYDGSLRTRYDFAGLPDWQPVITLLASERHDFVFAHMAPQDAQVQLTVQLVGRQGLQALCDRVEATAVERGAVSTHQTAAATLNGFCLVSWENRVTGQAGFAAARVLDEREPRVAALSSATGLVGDQRLMDYAYDLLFSVVVPDSGMP